MKLRHAVGKPVVGLTGGIASGKSTVAAVLRRLGVPVVDADALAREVVAPGSEGLQAVVRAFGEAYLRPDGTLDRAKLGELVFRDPEARRRLEAITHPRIAALAAQRLRQAASRSSAPYVVYEAPLIVEKGLQSLLDALIVVDVSPELQRARLEARDGLSSQQAERRIAAQLPLGAKRRAADYVVDNSGSLEATERQVERLHRILVQRFSKGP